MAAPAAPAPAMPQRFTPGYGSEMDVAASFNFFDAFMDEFVKIANGAASWGKLNTPDKVKKDFVRGGGDLNQKLDRVELQEAIDEAREYHKGRGTWRGGVKR